MKDKNMLVKFENKSNRVKGLAFHPRRPWILASLHNGVIQLWDYRMQTVIETYEEHDGPVRGVDFHCTQPLFVSGGDDYKIKVWNYQTKRCLFNLLGHLDYIRTVQFHQEYPWILSASDDQTIRIWNWQSRQCVSVLTGHNHYVMCAQFHPREDLVLSASLDQTVRVWDVSGLRKKTVSIAGENSNANNDLFGGTDVVVKHVLEGHARGVNWASFHPTLSLIVSAADDREVKLWRMNDAKVWEVDVMRGHINNVSCALFHPKKELIISNSEDKTIRVWDISKQASPLTFRRDSDRYWILDIHPTRNMIAAGHDSGLIVFKLRRERPPMDVSDKNLFYYKDQYIYEYNFKTDKECLILRRQRGGSNDSARTLKYNTGNRSQHNILLCSDSDASYELYTFAKGTEGQDAQSAQKGMGKCAVFVSRNRFAVLDKSRQVLLKNLKNETKRKISIANAYVNHIFEGGIGRLLLRTADAMLLYDIQSLKVVAELPIQSRYPIKSVSWSKDNKLVAMMSKANIHIANAAFEEKCTLSENTKIKSGAWDPCGVFVFTTSTHVKYLLPNGDSGIIRTVEDPIYLTMVNDKQLCYLDREGKVGRITIDNTEYLFKMALMKRRNKDVLKIMQSKKLVGQSIISYLQHKGYPEVALHFVEDLKSKFGLALECGNIDVALSCAMELNDNECWEKLGVEALRQGNHQVVEATYKKTQNFDKLSFLYLITGNTQMLFKMQRIAELRQDAVSGFHNALYSGDVRARVKILTEAGQHRLAYVTAKSHGLEDEAAELAEALGDDVPVIPKRNAKLLAPPIPILRDANWPVLELKKSFFDQLDVEPVSDDDDADPNAPQEAVELSDDSDAEPDLNDFGGGDGWGGDDLGIAVDDGADGGEGGGGGWGDLDLPDVGGDDAEDGGDEDDDAFVLPMAGKSASTKWAENSTLAHDLVAGGAFDQAMHALNRQIGVINFAPLKPLFMQVHNATFPLLPSLAGMPPFTTAMQRNSPDGKDLPVLNTSLNACVDSLKKGYQAVTDGPGKFQLALNIFTSILHTLPLVVVEHSRQQEEVNELKLIATQYITALKLALERKKTKDPVRAATLAAYFTKCNLQLKHVILGLREAIKACYNLKCYKTTAGFCRRLVDMVVSSPNSAKLEKMVNIKQIKGVLKLCEKHNEDSHKIDYSESSAFEICGETLTAVHKGNPSAQCPYCGSSYHGKYDGGLCGICGLSKIGSEVTGLRSCRKS